MISFYLLRPLCQRFFQQCALLKWIRPYEQRSESSGSHLGIAGQPRSNGHGPVFRHTCVSSRHLKLSAQCLLRRMLGFTKKICRSAAFVYFACCPTGKKPPLCGVRFSTTLFRSETCKHTRMTLYLMYGAAAPEANRYIYVHKVRLQCTTYP